MRSATIASTQVMAAGASSRLIEATREIAAERGGWVMYAQADRGDDLAIALYTKPGAREDVLHFDLAVSAQEPFGR